VCGEHLKISHNQKGGRMKTYAFIYTDEDGGDIIDF
jgi:hypothetical protein